MKETKKYISLTVKDLTINDNYTFPLLDGSFEQLLTTDGLGNIIWKSVKDLTYSTDDITEGLSNLYFTNERVDDRTATLIQNGTGISWLYNDIAGTLTPTVSLASFSTSNLSEGSNLYFTNERVDDRVSVLIQNGTGISWAYSDVANTLTPTVSLSPFTSDNLAEGSTNKYVTTSNIYDIVKNIIKNGTGLTWTQNAILKTLTGNISIASFNTDNLAEGLTNLYFTNERVDDRVATLIQDSATITWAYNDALGTLTATAANSPIQIQKSGILTSTRNTINFIPGSSIALTIADDGINSRANITVAVSNLNAFDTDDLLEGSSNLYFTNERVDDRVAILIQNGTGISWAYSDVANTLTPTITLSPFDTDDLSEGSINLYFTNERVDDRVAALIQDSESIIWTYDDSAGTLTADITGTITVQEDGNFVSNQSILNFIAGSNIILEVDDDPGNNRTNVTISRNVTGNPEGTLYDIRWNDVLIGGDAEVLNFSDKFTLTEYPTNQINVDISLRMSDLIDVTLFSPVTEGDILIYGASGKWENISISQIDSLIVHNDLLDLQGGTLGEYYHLDKYAFDLVNLLSIEESPVRLYFDGNEIAYISDIEASNELSEVLLNGNTTGGTDINFGTDKAYFSSSYIYDNGSTFYLYSSQQSNNILEIDSSGVFLYGAGGNWLIENLNTVTTYYGCNGQELMRSTPTMHDFCAPNNSSMITFKTEGNYVSQAEYRGYNVNLIIFEDSSATQYYGGGNPLIDSNADGSRNYYGYNSNGLIDSTSTVTKYYGIDGQEFAICQDGLTQIKVLRGGSLNNLGIEWDDNNNTFDLYQTNEKKLISIDITDGTFYLYGRNGNNILLSESNSEVNLNAFGTTYISATVNTARLGNSLNSNILFNVNYAMFNNIENLLPTGSIIESVYIRENVEGHLIELPIADFIDALPLSDYVDLTNNQSISGIKTFTSFPVTPSAAPTTDYQVANKKYVDDNIGGGTATYFHGRFVNSTSSDLSVTPTTGATPPSLSSIDILANLYEVSRNGFAAISSNNQIIVPSTGTYKIRYRGSMTSSSNNQIGLGVTVNGTTVSEIVSVTGLRVASSGTVDALYGEVILSLTINDVIRFFHWGSSASGNTTIYRLPWSNGFSIEKIS